MQFFEGYTVEELDKVLALSRYAVLLFLVLAALSLAVNQWLSFRRAELQNNERVESRTQIAEMERALGQARSQGDEFAKTFDQLTSTRRFTPKQLELLRSSLATGARGKVIITFLAVEWDAEEYAKRIGAVLQEGGFEVVVSDHLWVKFDHPDLFLASGGTVPLHGLHLQECFKAAGIPLPVIASSEIPKELGASASDVVLVVSHRK